MLQPHPFGETLSDPDEEFNPDLPTRYGGISQATQTQTQTQKLFIQPHIIQSKFSHTLRFNIMGQGDLH